MRITLTVVVVGLVLLGAVASRPTAQGVALPPIFAVGEQVVGPAGQLIRIASIHGEWIEIDIPDRYTNTAAANNPETGRTEPITGQWIHVPSAQLWGTTR